MRRVVHTNLCPLHFRWSYHVSKLTTPSFNGEKMSSLSVTLSGSTFRSIPAHNHTSTMNVFMPAITKARRHQCSRASNLVYSSSSLNINGKNSKHSEISLRLPRPHPLVHEEFLNQSTPLSLTKMSWSQHQLYLCRHQVLNHPRHSFFPKDRLLPQHQVVSLIDHSCRISNVFRTIM